MGLKPAAFYQPAFVKRDGFQVGEKYKLRMMNLQKVYS